MITRMNESQVVLSNHTVLKASPNDSNNTIISHRSSVDIGEQSNIYLLQHEAEYAQIVMNTEADLPKIREAYLYFEQMIRKRPIADCSDYVPYELIQLLQLSANPINLSTDARKLHNNQQSVKSNVSTPMSDFVKRLLGNSLYTKILRASVHECLRNATLQVNKAHPPINNPLAPIRLNLMFGLNKFIRLTFDGALDVKVTIIVEWRDYHWSWYNNTRHGIFYYLFMLYFSIQTLKLLNLENY